MKVNPDLAKCVFVVDRKNLDRQTHEEFNRFQEGNLEENTNAAAPDCSWVSEDYAYKVIVTLLRLDLVFETSNTERCKAA